ncbi:mediator of RNA polymerase II transcription subunit 15 [Toxorhynchites rutilus septentrionalis]|uniref:mediator of RNA polymerase II transcription subunit 15 n=1 Tax=Toxorhynchites rutilus septentrionalis TaxID=329112 RepID=UPI002478D126|nr:mediator of RNA polymerase II transcription subunit 15 [Toxorhynchites rutilus septentrionalis]
MAEDNSWKTSSFRQSVVNKINEAIQQSGMASNKNGLEMENHVFQKARNKDEYLGYVARLILHVREMNSKNKNQQNAAGGNQDGGNPNQQGGMPDPINALQTLASQGSRPQMMGGQMGPGGPMGGQMGTGNASNLLQTLNRPQMPMTGGMAGMQGGNRVGGMGGPNQMGGMMPGQMQPGQAGMPGMPNQMGGVMGPGGMSGGKIVGMGNQGQMGQMNPMQMQGQMSGGGMQPGAGQQQTQQQQGAPSGPNQMNSMGGMGGIQVNPQLNQNALSQQLSSVGMNQAAGQMGQMGGNSPMNQGNMGMAPNQVIRQQMAPGMNPNQQQMGMAGSQMTQMGQGIGGPGGNLSQVQQQVAAQQQSQAGMAAIGPGGPGNLQHQGGQQQQPSNVGPGQINSAGMGPGGNIPGNQMTAQGNFVPIGANQMVRKDMMSGGQVYPGGAVRSVTPNQFLRQSPSPSVPSPVGPGSLGSQSHPGQMIPSPALIPSPSPQMGSVPPRNIGQSPGSTLNTPGQPGGAVPSPLNPQDEQLYREKYRSLTKYIEPLKRMIAKMENDDIDKIAKMKRLLEILCNPTCRIPLETLYKCEAALTSQLGSIRETSLNNPLVEAVSSALQSNMGNHTLQRTFRPCLEALFGPDIKNLQTPAKRPRLTVEEPATSSTSGVQEIPHILQGEIARLDQKFKVSLDQCAVGGTSTIKLICYLDDKHLPCVPPVAVTIPEDYPFVSPFCSLIDQEYDATPFLKRVQQSFLARISKLPEMFSLSHLLDTWEMSVRQACAPKQARVVSPTSTSVLLGM